jgi:membrane protein DedA with SNARE-associated domain
MNIESLITEYGYLTVLLGAMIEGESIILTASALAALGHLSIFRVGLVTFCGTLIADQTIYFLGHFYGPKSLAYLGKKFPTFKPNIDKGLQFLKKHETLYILSFRFIYGIRIISPFIIGSQNISFLRFTSLNLIAAIVWTVISCSVGYFIGAVGSQFTDNIGLLIVGIVGAIIGISLLIGRIKKKKS